MHTHQPTGNAARELVQRMGEAANNFLASLSTDQRAKAQIDFALAQQRQVFSRTGRGNQFDGDAVAGQYRGIPFAKCLISALCRAGRQRHLFGGIGV